jgi:tetratricopeptide (TPR) repeat protein
VVGLLAVAPAPAGTPEMAEADRLLFAGEYGRAIGLYRNLANKESRGEQTARLRLAAALLKRDEAAAALRAAEDAVDAAPTADAHAMRSLARFRAGRFEGAEKDRNRALAIEEKESALGHLADARLLAAEGRDEEALRAVDRSIASDAFHDRVFRVDAYLLRSEVLDELDRAAEALEAHERATALSPPTNELLLTNLKAQAAFRRATVDRPLYRPAGGPDAATLKMVVRQGLPIVYLSVNGAEPQPFVVDSGAGICVLFPKAAKKLGFVTRDEPAWAGAVGGDGRVPIRYGLADRVALGEIAVENVPFAVIDWELPQIAGLVGLPLLRPFLTTFDYKRSELRLERNAKARAAAAGEGTVPFRLVGNAIFVDAFVNGRGPFNFELDTGAGPTAVPVDETTASAVGLYPHLPNARRARGAGAAGAQEAVIYLDTRVSWAERSPVTVSLISQRITPARPERRRGENGLTAETEVEGLIGYALLARAVVTIDFPKRTLTVR